MAVVAVYRAHEARNLLGLCDGRIVALLGRGEGSFEVCGDIALYETAGDGESEHLAADLSHAMCGLDCAACFHTLDSQKHVTRLYRRDGESPDVGKSVAFQPAGDFFLGAVCAAGLGLFQPGAGNGLKGLIGDFGALQLFEAFSGAGVDALRELNLGVGAFLPGLGEGGVRIDADGQRLASVEKPIIHAPVFTG